MFENLTSRLQEVFKKLRGKGKLTEKDIEEALREVRQALLEADAHYKVVKELLNNVKAKALQEDVLKSVTPAEQIIRILYYELLNILGGEKADLNLGSKKPGIILVVGLQGSGKTTTCAKLAYKLAQEQRRVLLVGADTFRPAAGKQLQILAEKIKVPVYVDGKDPFEIIDGALEVAKEKLSDVMIVDTTGRLHIDEEMMNELNELNKRYNPSEILLVVDGMTGQDAVNIAEKF